MATEIGHESMRSVPAKPMSSRALAGRAWARRRLSTLWVVAPLIVSDAACILFSMAMSYHLRFRVLEYHAVLSAAFYVRLAWVAVPLWLLTFALYRLYHPDHVFGGLQEYSSAFNACTAGIVVLVIYSFLDRRADQDISRGWLTMVWFFSVVSVAGVRFVYRRLVYRLRRRGLFVQRALVVGANAEGRAVVGQLQASPTAGIDVLGFVDSKLSPGAMVEDVPVLSDLNGLKNVVECTGVDELIIIPTALDRERLLDIYRDWGTDRNVHIRLSSGLYELFTTGVQVSEVGFVPLVSLNRTRITGPDALMKAVLDFVGASVGVALLAFVSPIIALLTWLDSPGPVIHRRRVVGLHGREFDAFKFRTMIPDADAYLENHPELKEEWEQTGKIKDDPRITRVGRFLRRYSFDELPQLLNVLRGEMSLVGPRMITPAELTHFGRWRHNLLTVKPGLTGLWQISGRADLSYEERVRMDMRYIRNYTVWQDLRLLFNTVCAVSRGRGAY
jgi:exopolysaccharide biosynthesis polyprenyl glycosylphosphotransferase